MHLQFFSFDTVALLLGSWRKGGVGTRQHKALMSTQFGCMVAIQEHTESKQGDGRQVNPRGKSKKKSKEELSGGLTLRLKKQNKVGI